MFFKEEEQFKLFKQQCYTHEIITELETNVSFILSLYKLLKQTWVGWVMLAKAPLMLI